MRRVKAFGLAAVLAFVALSAAGKTGQCAGAG